MRQLSKGESIGVSIAVVIVLGTFFFWGVIKNVFFQPQAVQDRPSLSLDSITSTEVTADATNTTNSKPTQPTMNPNQHTQADGLIIEDQVVGTGATAVAGQTVTVNYLGTFQANGQKFDSSYDRNQPFSFALGRGQVIKGWDEGVAGMKVGGKRKLIIPSSLAYGPNDYGPIPGGSTLVFEVELLAVK